jgi:hypothetical protein
MQNTEPESKPTAVVMIGLPGSGKSTWVKTFCKDAVVCSADNYFLENGIYEFRPSLLPAAHASCLRSFIEACQHGLDVVCDNTNVTPHALAPYIAVARAYGYNVRSVMCVAKDPGVAFERQVHGVPQVQHNFMRGNLNKMLEAWPGIWPELEVVKT